MGEVHTVPYGNLYIQDTDGNGVFQLHNGDKVFDQSETELTATQALKIDSRLSKDLPFTDLKGVPLTKQSAVALAFSDPSGLFLQANKAQTGIGLRGSGFLGAAALGLVWFFSRESGMGHVSQDVQAMTVTIPRPKEFGEEFFIDPGQNEDDGIDGDDPDYPDPVYEPGEDETEYGDWPVPQFMATTETQDDDEAQEVDDKEVPYQGDREDQDLAAQQALAEREYRYEDAGKIALERGDRLVDHNKYEARLLYKESARLYREGGNEVKWEEAMDSAGEAGDPLAWIELEEFHLAGNAYVEWANELKADGDHKAAQKKYAQAVRMYDKAGMYLSAVETMAKVLEDNKQFWEYADFMRLVASALGYIGRHKEADKYRYLAELISADRLVPYITWEQLSQIGSSEDLERILDEKIEAFTALEGLDRRQAFREIESLFQLSSRKGSPNHVAWIEQELVILKLEPHDFDVGSRTSYLEDQLEEFDED